MKATTATRRQVLGGGLAAATLATLAACGSGSSSDSGDVVEITYWHRLPDGEGMTKVDDIVARWNKENPGIHVTATKFDGKADESYAKIHQAVQAGDAPDLAQVGYAEILKLYTFGLFTDVSAQAEKYKEHFSEGSMSLMTVGKTVVGLPQDSGPLVYFYNKAAFDQLRLKVPTTSAELAKVAKKATEQGKYALAFEPDEDLTQ